MNNTQNNAVAPELTAELRHLHEVMRTIEILAEQPELAVVAYGRIWRFADMLRTAMRYAYLAHLHGFDIEPFRCWYNRDIKLFKQFDIRWLIGD